MNILETIMLVVAIAIQVFVIVNNIRVNKFNKMKNSMTELEADIQNKVYSEDTDIVWVETVYTISDNVYKKNVYTRICDIHDNKIKVWVDENKPDVAIAESDEDNLRLLSIVGEIISIALLIILVAFIVSNIICAYSSVG